MAICQHGRESIERDTETGVWQPEPSDSDVTHTEHTPAVAVPVEHARNGEPCVACAWDTNPAVYRVAGDVFVCADHLATGVNIGIAYLSAKAS